VHEFHVLVFDPSHPATEITDSPDHAGCLQSPRFAAASPQVGFPLARDRPASMPAWPTWGPGSHTKE
jgi:hypothetical protein